MMLWRKQRRKCGLNLFLLHTGRLEKVWCKSIFICFSFCLQIFNIYISVFIRINNNDLHATHSRCCWVGSMSWSRNQTHFSLSISSWLVVTLNGKKAGIFSRGSWIGLERAGVKVSDDTKHFFKFLNHFEISSDLGLWSEGVDWAKLWPWNRNHFYSSIQFHCAWSKRNHWFSQSHILVS